MSRKSPELNEKEKFRYKGNKISNENSKDTMDIMSGAGNGSTSPIRII